MSGDDSGAGKGIDQKVKNKVIADTYKGEMLFLWVEYWKIKEYLLLER